MREQWAETLTGFFVVILAVCFLGYALLTVGNISGRGEGYDVFARFSKANGLASGADVRLSGVKIGSVSHLELDPQTYMAKVNMQITGNIGIPGDSTAKIASDGLLGGAYIAIDPGGEETMIPKGGEFLYTQGSVDLFQLLGQAFLNREKKDTQPQ